MIFTIIKIIFYLILALPFILPIISWIGVLIILICKEFLDLLLNTEKINKLLKHSDSLNLEDYKRLFQITTVRLRTKLIIIN